VDNAEWRMHIRAGVAYGAENTCGVKIDWRSEARAVTAAARMSEKTGRDLEAYPCAFCTGWHIGRRMTAEERKEFAS